MTRRMSLGGLLLLLCLGALGWLGLATLDRDRDAARDALARQQLHAVSEAAAALRDALVGIGDDLTLASTLLDGGPEPTAAARQLAAVVARDRNCLLMVATAPSTRAVAVGAPPAIVALAAPLLEQQLAAARRAPGELAVSAGLSSRDDDAAWYRVFAIQPGPDRVAIAALIDMRLLVQPPQLLRGDASRLLVLSAHGVPAPASDPAMAELARGLRDGTIDDAGLRDLLDRAAQRHAGTAVVSPDRARALQLPAAPAVAAAAPVIIDRGAPWILMSVSSTAALDEQHAATIRRIAAGAAVALALVIAAAVLIIRAARRTEAMRERLRHVDLLLRSEKLATAGQLAAGIAHEIGTPLNVARGRAELTLQRLGADHPQAQNQQLIVGQIDHVTGLIKQLLDYVGPQPAAPQAIEVGGALRAVVELLAAQAASRKVALVIAAAEPGAPAVVHADPSQLQQVLVNLVMNAIDACGTAGTVTLATTARPGAIGIAVSDDGPGISPENRALVFDPFFTTKKRGQGTGLGLWVVAQLARAHGAEIELADAHDRASAAATGTTFRIWWPLATMEKPA